MNMQRYFPLLVAGAAAAATPVLGQAEVPPIRAPDANTQSAAPFPDFSGIWRHPSFPGFEPPVSGPGPVTNRARTNGRSDLYHSVGDYTNPILKPQAAEVVRKHGEMAFAGGFPTPSTQCTPAGVPYIFASFGTQLLQQPHRITILYSHPFVEFRQVRMNEPHAVPVKPSWYGDSVGHYEGDTLVIDTVGLKVGPYSMVDLFGTPFTAALHVVERYRLLDYEDAKEGLERNTKENNAFAQNFDFGYRGKHLQLQFTVEDEGVFTMPWTATITYGRGFSDLSKSLSPEWDEHICADNPSKYYGPVPMADKPDF